MVAVLEGVGVGRKNLLGLATAMHYVTLAVKPLEVVALAAVMVILAIQALLVTTATLHLHLVITLLEAVEETAGMVALEDRRVGLEAQGLRGVILLVVALAAMCVLQVLEVQEVVLPVLIPEAPALMVSTDVVVEALVTTGMVVVV